MSLSTILGRPLFWLQYAAMPWRSSFFEDPHLDYWIQQNQYLLFSLPEYKINGLVNIRKLIAIEFIRSKLNPNSKDLWFIIHDCWRTRSLLFSCCESKESDIKNLILKYPKETRPDFRKTLSRPLNREKMLLRHVTMVAKFLDDNPWKRHLKSGFALFQTSSIFNMWILAKFSGLSRKGSAVFKFRETKSGKILCCVHLLHKGGALN